MLPNASCNRASVRASEVCTSDWYPLPESSSEQDEDNEEDEDEDNEDDMSLLQHLPGEKRGKEEPRLPVSELEAHRFLGCRLKMLASEGKVHEGCAAFGCLAELATRRRSPLRPAAPQEALSSSSSLPRRIFVPAERCKPPYSREWLLAHRPHCGSSPLRPTALHSYSAELRSPSASAVLADAARVVTTHPQRASAPAAYKLDARSRRALNKLGVDWSGAPAKNLATLEELVVGTNSP